MCKAWTVSVTRLHVRHAALARGWEGGGWRGRERAERGQAREHRSKTEVSQFKRQKQVCIRVSATGVSERSFQLSKTEKPGECFSVLLSPLLNTLRQC